MRVGSVQLLRRFPLRSAAGEHPEAVEVGAHGLDGDRRWTLVDATGEALTGKRLPALAGVAARVVAGDLVVDAGSGPLAGAERDRALAELAGQPVSLRRGASHSGGAAVHVVSDGAAGAPDAPAGCEPGERANVVLALDPAVAPPGAERGWVGARLRLGEAEVVVTRTPRSCLGVYAEVVVAGRVGCGDDAVLLEHGGPGETAEPATAPPG